MRQYPICKNYLAPPPAISKGFVADVTLPEESGINMIAKQKPSVPVAVVVAGEV